MNFEDIKKWYDGYRLGNDQIYNPNSVCKCMRLRQESNYWTGTSSFDSVRSCINMDFDGLKTALIEMLAGIHDRYASSIWYNNEIPWPP